MGDKLIFKKDGSRVRYVEGVPLPVILPTEGKTAFGELITAQLSPQIQGSFEYTVDNTDLNTNTEVNTGTVTQASAMCVVGTGTTTASTALFQSKQHAKYRAGLGGLSRFTALFNSPVANTEQYQGIMDAMGSSAAFKNGFSVGYDGVTFGFHRFRDDVKITINQADWDDPLDGTGMSGMVLDPTKLNVFYIQFQYLGAGAIKLYVEDDTTGIPIIVYTLDYANLNVLPTVFNPNFHHTLWVNNGSTTSNIVSKSGSYGYFIEGKTSFIELHQPTNSSGINEKTGITTEIPIFTIRNKSTFASKTNFIDIYLLNMAASSEATAANNQANIRLIKNATLGGDASVWNDINTTNSVVEIDVAATTVANGIEISPGLMAGKNGSFKDRLSDYKMLLNPGETLTIAGNSANSATIDAYLLWRELF